MARRLFSMSTELEDLQEKRSEESEQSSHFISRLPHKSRTPGPSGSTTESRMATSSLLARYQSPPARIESLPKPSRCFFRTSRVLRISSHYKSFEVRDLSYRPPGTQQNLLNEVSLSLPEKSFGLIFGRSGSGKTTLLQILAGLSQPTSGYIHIQRLANDGKPVQPPEALSPERVGIVFQFPERYFLAESVLEEVTFGWPRRADSLAKEKLASRLEAAFCSVGLKGISFDKDPHSLSGGFKRRLALAIQLVQKPDLLLLDEPLAGLDWKARVDVVNLIKHLKMELTILVVSHDLKELSSLVDQSWRMEMGGVLKEEPLPV
ncbi:hypothetical protein H6P81_012077 [Aristolochia fimbriata]|uniref:ABC transporter domain-containing protein n=1 Tax=Aristolochia fimbriata TaxID=158543 RepID=A0AAV7EBC6_ARIFI|nr:hypothetical protein H6P81_012077 [Aristolochia fimbriata]